MKPQILEALKMDENGVLLDPWQRVAPRIFHTAEARHLFAEAEKAGIILYYPELEIYGCGPGITKGQLAYWCKKASAYLGIDRGGNTNWKPFAVVFHYPGKPLRNDLHSVGFYSQDPFKQPREDLTDPIDKFFKALDGEPGPGTDPSTITSTEDQ